MNQLHEYFSPKIKFKAEDHTYTYNGTPCISVTTLLGSLEVPFDSQSHSKRYAEKNGLTQQHVLKMWADKAKNSQVRGTAIHRYIECLLLGIGYDMDFIPSAQEIASCEAILKHLTDEDIEPYALEQIVGDEESAVCGTIDFVGRRRKTKEFVIYDWKTNVGKDLVGVGRFDKSLLPPLSSIVGSKHNVYSLQLSIYQAILGKHFSKFRRDETPMEKMLFHIDGGLTKIPTRDFVREARILLEHRRNSRG